MDREHIWMEYAKAALVGGRNDLEARRLADLMLAWHETRFPAVSYAISARTVTNINEAINPGYVAGKEEK